MAPDRTTASSSPHSALEIDRRAAAWHFFTFYPRFMSERVGTVYLTPTADSSGQPIEAGRTYRVRVPKDIPARQFWSLTVYDEATWALIPTRWTAQVWGGTRGVK